MDYKAKAREIAANFIDKHIGVGDEPCSECVRHLETTLRDAAEEMRERCAAETSVVDAAMLLGGKWRWDDRGYYKEEYKRLGDACDALAKIRALPPEVKDL